MSGNLVPYDPNAAEHALVPQAGTDYAGLWSASPAAATPTESGPQWARYVAALKRYKWLMAAVIVVGTGLGFVATRFIAPSYEVQSAIWISQSNPNDQRSGPIRAREILEPTAFVELFQSFAVVDAVVDQTHLYLTPSDKADSAVFAGFRLGERVVPGTYDLTTDPSGRYTLTEKGGNLVVEQGQMGDSVGRNLGFRWAPSASAMPRKRSVEFTVVTPRDASVALLRSVNVVLPRNSNFLRISLKGEDPRQITRVMNLWIQEFVNAAADAKKRNTVEFSKILQGQLTYAEKELKDAEGALQSFRVHVITLPSEGSAISPGLEMTRDPVFQNFFQQKVQYENARRDREALENMLAGSARGSLTPEALYSIPGLLEGGGGEPLRSAISELNTKEAQLRALRQTYTDEHPRVRELAQQVQALQTGTIPELSRGVLAQLRTRETDLGKRIETASSDMRAIPTRPIEEMRLRRDVEASANLYNTLLNRYEEAKLAQASAVPDVSILDSAVTPQRPATNTAPKLIILALLASFGLAVGLALLLDRLDSRFRYPTQATEELGLQIIGAVPTIRRGRNAAVDLEEAAQVVESFRSIRLNIRHAFDAGGPLLFTVTSPGVHDGKSLVSSNLALAFAEGGYRTVLVDGDTRRGTQHAMFGVDQRPGLLDFLAGETGLDDVVRTTQHEKLSIVPCGTRRHRGPELIASPVMNALVGELATRFDVVVVDSPPLSAGIDPYALSTATGNLLLVLRAGETDRKLAQAKLRVVQRLPVRLLGAVLNDVRTTEGEYRYYSYEYGYTTTEDSVPQMRSKVGEIAKR